MGKGKSFMDEYPKCIFCILGNEFCERFSFYGMKAILVIYLSRALMYDDNSSTAIYHGFNVACYFMPLFGAILADGWIGKYKTIVYLSIVYCFGNAVMALTAIPYGGSYNRWSPFIALALIAIGTGGIKPCVSAFGGDQFEDHQVRQKEAFFSVFYMSINLGSLLSMVITPILKSEVMCFNDSCYSLAFGIPSILMVVALAFFIFGTKWYRIVPTSENTIAKMFGCVTKALVRKCSCGGNNPEEPKEHWLDHAEGFYERTFIAELKGLFKVMLLFLPLCIFWALFDQQGSRWTLQAGQMDGDFGKFVIQPDMIQVVNPILIVIMVPILESAIFPCLTRLGVPNSPLQRLGFGMFLAGTAFVAAAGLQLIIDNDMPASLGEGMAKFRYINAAPCGAEISLRGAGEIVYPFERVDIKSGSKYFEVPYGKYTFDVKVAADCPKRHLAANLSQTFVLNETLAYQLLLSDIDDKYQLSALKHDKVYQTGKGKSTVWVINALPSAVDARLRIDWELRPRDMLDLQPLTASQYEVLTRANYDFSYSRPGHINESTRLGDVISKSGAVYTVVLQYDTSAGEVIFVQHEDVAPNGVNVFWQIPQYFIMSIGECFFSVTGLSFAYSQAPMSMKSVLQAAWLITNAVGNLIVVFISKVGRLPNQVAEFLLFAGLMYATVFIFVVMSMSYEYVSYGGDPENVTKEDFGDAKQNGGDAKPDGVVMTQIGSDAKEEDEKKATDGGKVAQNGGQTVPVPGSAEPAGTESGKLNKAFENTAM